MTTVETVTTLNLGDTVPIGTVLADLIIMGIVTDVNNPNMFAATLQAHKSQALLTVPVLQGDQGPPGQPTFALQFQNEDLESPSQLPDNLTDLERDLGKYWVFGVTDENGNVIATVMYVWYGTTIGWREFPVGSPGPPGPYPMITPQIVLLDPGNGGGPNGADSWIHVSGTVSSPTFTFYIAAPQGLPGPAPSLAEAPDVDLITNAPQSGDALICSTRVVPGSPIGLTITPFSTGGQFPAAEFFWVVTSTLANGAETMASNEVATTFVGNTSSVQLSWTAPSGKGATGYRVYRGESATNISKLVGTITDGATTTFTDTGLPGVPGEPPSVNVVEGRPIWVPHALTPIVPLVYTVPSSAFQSMSGIGGSKQSVCTFNVPPQAWPWKPIIFGHMKIFGLNISFTPLLVGAEVRLADPMTGQVVAVGVGNSLGMVTLIPQPSTKNNPSTAMTPTNGVGLVQANHTGTQGTLYVNLVNEGMAATYDFNNDDASLVVFVVPVPGSAEIIA